MPLQLSQSDWRAIFPKAPNDIIDSFTADSTWLAKAGILESRVRLAYALANVEHECGGFTVKNLTENINYTAKRLAVVFSNRFASADEVVQRYGSKPGWQLKAFDEIYGNRMGNRPGTNDGSRYIGRGGPQITGRDGYRKVGDLAGLDLVNQPELATLPTNQPAILASFWTWKGMNGFADAGNFLGAVKAWNGGTKGIADRKALMAGNDPVISKLKTVAKLQPILGP